MAAGKITILVLGSLISSAHAVDVVIDSTVQGLPFTADNLSYRTPAAFHWEANSQHMVAFSAIYDGGPGVRYQFRAWSDSDGSYVRSIAIGASNTSYTAAFTTEYLVTAAASPANGGTVTGGRWYAAGSSAAIQAHPATGFTFSTFSGDWSGNGNPATISVGKPLKIIANFVPAGKPEPYVARQ
jgi:Divergent InlB B-repeat domain